MKRSPLVATLVLAACATTPTPSGTPEAPLAAGAPPDTTAAALDDALAWLARHQGVDGSWDADGFGDQCPEGQACDGQGFGLHDVAVTGLALLAFLGDGQTVHAGPHRDTVAGAIRWLREQQDPDTGCIGERAAHTFLYEHAIATLALCEAYALADPGNPLLRATCGRAADYCARARNPYGAWRYDEPPLGDNDTSVTGWMVLALASARDAGLAVDPANFEGARSWISEVTDPASGRVGYAQMGSRSSRVVGVNDHFPTTSGEAMTAMGLLVEDLAGAPDTSLRPRQAALIAERLPSWPADEAEADLYAWLFGTWALCRTDGPAWGEWAPALEAAAIAGQRRDGDAVGSWDPIGAWCYAGGRVYATALLSLCLETRRHAEALVARR